MPEIMGQTTCRSGHRASISQEKTLGMAVKFPTLVVAFVVAGVVGLLSAVFPAYHAAKLDIVEGLRYIG